jgi:capsid protein
VHDQYEHTALGGKSTWQYIPRVDGAGRVAIQHLLRRERIRQTRGMPWLMQGLDSLDDVTAFRDAELIRHRLLSAITLIHKTAISVPPPVPGEKPATFRLAPGATIQVPPGEDLEPFVPDAKGAELEQWVRYHLGIVAASRGFSAMLAMHDFTDANYSVSRMTFLDAQKAFGQWQSLFAHLFYQQIYNRVIEWGWIEGMLPQVPLFGQDGRRTPWTTELLRMRAQNASPGWIDPEVEFEAYEKAVRNRFMSPQQVADRTGNDYYDTIDEIAEARDYAEQAGLGGPAEPEPDDSGEAGEPVAQDEPEGSEGRDGE